MCKNFRRWYQRSKDSNNLVEEKTELNSIGKLVKKAPGLGVHSRDYSGGGSYFSQHRALQLKGIQGRSDRH